jgi:2Fe-2S ferredoxin
MSDFVGEQTVPVRVLPAGVLLEVGPGETVFLAAARLGYSWPTICGGVAECGSCISNITEGVENCTAPADAESETLARVRPGRHQHDPAFRLACQLQVIGPVTLTKRGVRPVG